MNRCHVYGFRHIKIDEIVQDLHGAYEMVENQGNVLVSLNSSYLYISDTIKVNARY